VHGGRTPGPPHRVGGVLAVPKPRDEDQVKGGRGVPNQVVVQGREDRKRDHHFLTMPAVPRSDPRRWCNTREQNHGGHYFGGNRRLLPTH